MVAKHWQALANRLQVESGVGCAECRVECVESGVVKNGVENGVERGEWILERSMESAV